MIEKDKQILKDSSLAVADGIVALVPPLAVAWNLSKALYGAGLKLRQQRALEWVEMVRDNPSLFTKELLEQEDFQDAFVYALEKYLLIRSEDKRVYMRSVFLGFCMSENRKQFDLERYIHTLEQLNDGDDMYALARVDTRTQTSYQLFDDAQCLQSVYHLISLGIIYADPNAKWGPIHSPYVYTSDFGVRFVKYLAR